jgi:GNAT superfamily N-acetyltransferase
MAVRPVRSSDREAVLEMRRLLWPDDDGEHDIGESVLVWDQDGSAAGFVVYSLRPWADGCDERPVHYIEGWFVREELRRRGIGRALIDAVADRARAQGCRELGSDALLDNRLSLTAHRRLGFEPTEQLQLFRLDLDHRRVRQAIVVEPFAGPRDELIPLFAKADDSPAQIAAYLGLGKILVARRAGSVIGHVQIIATGGDWEIKSVAVVDREQGKGTGTALVRAALDRAFSAGAARVLVAAATADIGNLRFYQHLGFRMDRVERDAFTTDRGYPTLCIDGIPLRDRVWFSIEPPK